MKLFKYCLLSLIIIFPFVISSRDCSSKDCPKKEKIKARNTPPHTLFFPRSQGAYKSRQLAGWQYVLPGCDCRASGDLAIALEYEQSTHPERIARYLFGTTCLNFSGSQVINRNPNDLLADNFGLPTTFKGSICFKPKIESWIIDLNFHLNLENWVEGFYVKLFAPIVHSDWNIGITRQTSNITNNSIPVFPPCYMGNSFAKTAQSILQALGGCSPFGSDGSSVSDSTGQAIGNEEDFTFGDLKLPLQFGKFNCEGRDVLAIADLDLIFGWNFLLCQSGHVGIFAEIVAPTGNKPTAEFIFEPIVGNGRLWELGGGISAHYAFVDHGPHSLGLYFEGSILKQFKRIEARSFDFCNGPLSRYMLLKEFNDNNQYVGNLINGIDFSTRAVRAGGSVKGEAAIKLSYYYNKWGFDLGYNIYGRTQEDLKIIDGLYPSDFNNRLYGIKGTEGVCYRVFDTISQTVIDEEPLNSTQNCATIRNGAKTDNQSAIVLPENELPLAYNSPTNGNFIIAQNSNPPIIIDRDSLDIRSAIVPKQLTHGFFAHIDYIALEKCWEPQIGIGGLIEFDGFTKIMSSLNKWAVWLKGSISF